MGPAVASLASSARGKQTCAHCGLGEAQGGLYCCYGCELAARIDGEGKATREGLYAVITLCLLLSMIVMMLSLFLFAEDVYGAGTAPGLAFLRKAYRVASLLLSTPVVLLLGAPLARRAVLALRGGKLSMDLLIAAGAFAAYALSVVAVARGDRGVYFDSATSALVLATLGRYLEASARARASGLIGPSLGLGSASVLAAQGDGPLARVLVSAIEPGMILELEADEPLPVDARLLPDGAPEGVEVNLGVLTGAAAPVHRRPGEELPAGAIPVSGKVRCVALRTARESTLELLAQAAFRLKDQAPRLARLGDAFARAMVPAVAALAAVTFAVTAGRASLDRAVVTSLAVVLAACPCTFGVATPLVLWLALRKALEGGVCIRSARTLEALATTRVVAFDKTGTLTDPRLAVLAAELEAGAPREEVRALVAALEAGSRHPVGRALAGWADTPALPATAVVDRKVLVGRGVSGRDLEGRALLLGSARWLESLGVGVDADARGTGWARVALACDGSVLARFAIGEAVRPEAFAALAVLAADGVAAVMLTGDTAEGSQAVGSALGLEVRASLSPTEKPIELRRLGPGVAMVGDGSNDAPALAEVGPSFAMEGGTGLSRGLSQVALLRPDLRLVPWTLRLARRSMQIGWQNLIGSTLYNLVFLGLAASGSLRPVWAGLSMLTSSLLTLASSLRVAAIPVCGADQGVETPRELTARRLVREMG